jgi:hypothetical protein
VELGVGLLLLSGLYWQRLRWVALSLFASFALYSLSLALSGATSCGCFGAVNIHPWWTFSLDLAVVLGLLIAIGRAKHSPESAGKPEMPASLNHRRIATATIAVSVISAALLARYVGSRTALAEGVVSAGGNLTILEPEKWIGKFLPVAADIDVDLSRGNWIVLFHRHDCPDCGEAVPRYEELALRSRDKQVALVEVPPFHGSADAAVGPSRRARLSGDREWFVQTPVEIQLVDGVVTSASNELPALNSQAGR